VIFHRNRAAADEILAALPGFLSGMTKWRDLANLDIAAVMDFELSESGHDRRELDRLAPVRMEVPSGSHLIIHYDGDEPTVEARLQECFGLMETPKLAGGRVPVVMTLLSPAHRPVQVTKDLAGLLTSSIKKCCSSQYSYVSPEMTWLSLCLRSGSLIMLTLQRYVRV
jgi:HrpA-like RNA helicase